MKLDSKPKDQVSNKAKGDRYEALFFAFIEEELKSEKNNFGFSPNHRIEIELKKNVYGNDCERDVEHDIILSHYREGAKVPFRYDVFECKDYGKNIPENQIRIFSDKLGESFRHNAKGYIVSKTPLTSGAEKTCENRGLGVIRFDEQGIEFILERELKPYFSKNDVKTSLKSTKGEIKPLKFAAILRNEAFADLPSFLDFAFNDKKPTKVSKSHGNTKFLTEAKIEEVSQGLLNECKYTIGPVPLKDILQNLDFTLTYKEAEISAVDEYILGYANFPRKEVVVYESPNLGRMNFTLAHEIGHIALGHNHFLRSEYLFADDFKTTENKSSTVSRLEFQANLFASFILLPTTQFRYVFYKICRAIGYKFRVDKRIFVDDQQCNLNDYHRLLESLSGEFQVSKQVCEIRLKRMGYLNDQRSFSSSVNSPFLSAVYSACDAFK